MRNFFAALPLALVLSACMTPAGDPYGQNPYPQPQGEPYPQPYPDQGYPVPPGANDYRASGTEPFWDITIGRDMVFTDRGTGLTITQPTPQVVTGTAGPVYRTQRLEVNVTHNRCNDGMSDRSYPDTVQVYADGRLYRGCGGLAANDPLAPTSGATQPGYGPNPPAPPYGAPASPPPYGPPGAMDGPPLDRTRWLVMAINGRPVPRDYQYWVEFDGGKLNAKFGCNSIGTGYTQTGSTIDAGAIIATKMACGDMGWETQGIAVIDQPMQVSAQGPTRITLTSSAGSIELLRR